MHICTVTVYLHSWVYILHIFTPTNVGVFLPKMCKTCTFFYIHCYCSCAYYYFINFIISNFFSLYSLCAKRTQSQTSLLLIFFFLRYRQTHPHRQINTKIHKYTHTNKPTKREREISVGVGCLWIGGSVLAVEIGACGSTESVIMG